MAKKKTGFTPEINKLFDALYEKLREYGQCCAYIAISDNKNQVTKRIGVVDKTTCKEVNEIIYPDLAIINAMDGNTAQEIAGRNLVYNAVLSYLHEHPEELPEFYEKLQIMIADLLGEYNKEADTPVEAEIPIIVNANPNPHGDC